MKRYQKVSRTVVRREKSIYLHVETILVLAYLRRDVDASRYDGTTYPPLEAVPLRYAILKRNEWMVCESDIVISGVTHGWGGAAKTLNYANRKGKVVVQFPIQPQVKYWDATSLQKAARSIMLGADQKFMR